MSNDVHIKITADKPNTTGIRDTTADLDKLKAKAKETTPVIDGLTKSSGDSAKGFTDTKSKLAALNDSLAISKDKLTSLAHSFADTQDAAQKLDIGKSMAKVQNDINLATKAKKLIIDAEPKVNDSAKNRFLSGMANLGSLAGNKVGITLGVAAGAALLPVLAPLVSAAVLGGAGLGGIAGGVALAANDPTVAKFARQLGKGFKADLDKEATGIFQKPVLDSLKVIQSGSKTALVSIGQIFSNVAPYVRPLTEDLNMAAQAILGSLAGASAKAGPVLLAFGDSLVTVAGGVSDFITMVSSGGPEAASSLHLITGALADFLRQTGLLIEGLNKASSTPWLTGPIFQLLKKHYDDAAEGSRTLGDSTGDLVAQMSDAERAARGEQDALAALSQELKGQTDPVFAMFSAQDKLAKAHRDAAKAEKDHGRNSEDYRKAVRDAASASLDLEGAVGTLGDQFDGHLSPALRSSLEAAGMTKGEINSLEKQFQTARKKGDDFAKTYAAKAVVNGVPTARHNIQTLKQELQSMKTNWNITVRTSFLTFGKPYSQAGINANNIGGLASGGIKGAANGQTSGGLTWVGERGPELADLGAGSRVWSAGDSARMAKQGGDGGALQLIVSAAPGSSEDLVMALVTALRFDVSRKGSGNVQKHLGQPGRG
jgi:hypothetical protein